MPSLNKRRAPQRIGVGEEPSASPGIEARVAAVIAIRYPLHARLKALRADPQAWAHVDSYLLAVYNAAEAELVRLRSLTPTAIAEECRHAEEEAAQASLAKQRIAQWISAHRSEPARRASKFAAADRTRQREQDQAKILAAVKKLLSEPATSRFSATRLAEILFPEKQQKAMGLRKFCAIDTMRKKVALALSVLGKR